MASRGERIVVPANPPDETAVRDWLGARAWRHWQALVMGIEADYPGVFAPDWVYGGKTHGWSLRFKRSKSFCTLIPEYRRLLVQIVFGKAEQAKAEKMIPQLRPALRELYAAAPTFTDGKWLAIPIQSQADLADVARLLSVKRRPSRKGQPASP
jgi:hypothetical protein